MSFFIRKKEQQGAKSKKLKRSQNVSVGGRAKKAKPDDDEILSDSESDLESGGEAPSSEDDAAETAQEKRLRLAKKYLQQLQAEETEKREAEQDDVARDAVAHRIREDILEHTGRLQKNIAQYYLPIAEDAVRVLRGHKLSVTCAVTSSDDKHVYSGAKDGSIAKWELQSGRKVKLLKGARVDTEGTAHAHTAHVLCMALTTDRAFLATGDKSGVIYVWNAATLERLGELKGHRGAVSMSMSKLGAYYYEGGSRPRTPRTQHHRPHRDTFNPFVELFMTIADELTESETNKFRMIVQLEFGLQDLTNDPLTIILTKLFFANTITKGNVSFLKKCLIRLKREDLLPHLSKYIYRSTTNLHRLSQNVDFEDDYTVFPDRYDPKRHSSQFGTYASIPSGPPLAEEDETLSKSRDPDEDEEGFQEPQGDPDHQDGFQSQPDERTDDGSDPHASDFSMSSAELVNGSGVTLNPAGPSSPMATGHVEDRSTDDEKYKSQMALAQAREPEVKVERQLKKKRSFVQRVFGLGRK